MVDDATTSLDVFLMDGFSGYNQINIYPYTVEKTAFGLLWADLNIRSCILV